MRYDVTQLLSKLQESSSCLVNYVMKAIIYSEKILWQRFKVAHSVDHYTGSMTQSLIEVVVIETQASRQWLEGDVKT